MFYDFTYRNRHSVFSASFSLDLFSSFVPSIILYKKWFAQYDSSKPKRATFPNLKPSLKSISIRVPESMLAELKILANKKDVPYQSLAKIFLARQIAIERGSLDTLKE